MSDNIHPIFDRLVSQEERHQFFNQKAQVFWFTGLSGSGKSTIAISLERKLFSEGFFSQVIDGDNTRSGLCNNLGFSLEDRRENIRRVAELSKLYINSGIICLNSFVSPTDEIRTMAREIIGASNFHLIHVNATLEVCEARDVKGLYAKARNGEIKGFTGIDSPYQIPTSPELILPSSTESIETCTDIAWNYIKTRILLQ